MLDKANALGPLAAVTFSAVRSGDTAANTLMKKKAYINKLGFVIPDVAHAVRAGKHE